VAGPEATDADGQQRATTFVTALVAGALTGVADPEAETVRRRAVDFLLGERGPQWSFNYWARGSKEAAALPYPDDWDDTSCALSAIMRLRPEAVGGEVLAAMVNLLTATEVAEGGPYRTWMVGAEAGPEWHDVDVAVNCNIAYMLSLQEVELPSLVELLERALAAGELRSPYYPTGYPLVYFASRWYRGPQVGRLREWLELRKQGGWWGDPLRTALAVSASLNLGARSEEVAGPLAVLMSRPLGSLGRAYPFCYDPAAGGRRYVAGAPALTAALMLESVAKFEEAVARVRRGVTARSAREAASARLHEQVLSRVWTRFEFAGPDLAQAAGRVTDRVIRNDPAGQVTLLPWLWRRAMGEAGRAVSDERLVKLGALSLLGWMAYTVYDDFLDNEGDPQLLPLANLALREVTAGFNADPSGPGLATMTAAVLDRMDAANAWEVNHCRVASQEELLRVAPPDYDDLSQLAERSMGHALGALTIMLDLGRAADSPEVSAVEGFFRHFLTARQLNDEAHDWKTDLQNGHINAVAARLLAAVGDRGDSVQRLYDQLEQVFWEREIGPVCERVLEELALARVALARAGVAHPEELEVLLEPVSIAAQRALEGQRQTLDFLRAYRDKNDGGEGSGNLRR